MTILLQGAGLQTVVAGGGDPIGDALRVACVGCWTLNESASGPWADSTTFNNPLLATVDITFESIAGKIGNAIRYTDAMGANSSIQPNSFVGTFSQWSISCWVKIHTTFGPGSQSDIAVLPNQIGLATDGNDNLLIYANPPYTLGAIIPITSADWHHVVVTSDFTHHRLYIDNVLRDTVEQTQSTLAYQPVLLTTAGWNNTDTYALDEFEVFNVVISTDDIAYLWNSGAGRALYP